MPFGACRWENGQPILDMAVLPEPELRQTDDRSFVLLRSFCFRAPDYDPEAGTTYVVPGADAPRSTATTRTTGGSGPVVVPPSSGGGTDLASVPRFMWWLVASYGNHTRAALLHDALVADTGAPPPIPRTAADRLFLNALREPGQKKGGHFRHWLMWAAVSVFGTMRPLVWPLAFCAHVVASWVLFLSSLAWIWGSVVWHPPWTVGRCVLATVVTALAVTGFQLALGVSWRAGIDRPRGWLAPTTVVGAIVVAALWSDRDHAFEWSADGRAFWTLLAVSALILAGGAWGVAVDPTLKLWLWPTSFIGLPIAVIPLGLIVVSLALVWLVDLGASLLLAFTKGPDGKRRGVDVPDFMPDRWAP